MPKNRAALLLLGFALAGCSHPSSEVYVDAQAVLVAEPVYSPPAPATASPPQPLPVVSASLPPLSEEIVQGESNANRKAADELVRKNRVRAYRELESRLREVYLADLKRREDELIGALAPARDLAQAEARNKIRTLFERYGAERGPLITRIALLAGFPDPDPQSKRQPVSDSPVVRMRYDEAKKLRAQVAALDSEYRSQVSAMLAQLDKDEDAELTRIKASLEIARNDAEEKARRDAASQERSIEANVGSSLADEGGAILPAVDGKTATFVPPTISTRQPDVESSRVLGDEASRLRDVKDQIAIWLAINGYRQADSRKNGRDRTGEFIEWRKSHHLGP